MLVHFVLLQYQQNLAGNITAFFLIYLYSNKKLHRKAVDFGLGYNLELPFNCAISP